MVSYKSCKETETQPTSYSCNYNQQTPPRRKFSGVLKLAKVIPVHQKQQCKNCRKLLTNIAATSVFEDLRNESAASTTALSECNRFS